MSDDAFNKSLAKVMTDKNIPLVAPTVVTVVSNAVTPVIVAKDGNHYVVNVVTPVVAILVRFLNTFLTSLLGILSGAMATSVITAIDFVHLVYKCAGLALAGAVIGLIKDLITVFGNLEGKYPLATGSI